MAEARQGVDGLEMEAYYVRHLDTLGCVYLNLWRNVREHEDVKKECHSRVREAYNP